MLLLTALFVSLSALLGCSASSPALRYVVDARRPRGLAPRQNIAGVMLDGPSDPPGTGITPLVLAADHRCALNYPILARETSGPEPSTYLQLILCNNCRGEHQLQACGRHGILGHVHHLHRLFVSRLPFDSKVPSEVPEPDLRHSQR